MTYKKGMNFCLTCEEKKDKQSRRDYDFCFFQRRRKKGEGKEISEIAMKNKRKQKQVIVLLLAITFLFGLVPAAMAQTMAPVKIYALVEEGLHHDIHVTLISVEDENETYDFVVTEQDNWAINGQVPAGEYRAEAKIPGFAPGANVQARAQFMPEVVDAKAEGLNIATFTVMQATAVFMEKHGSLVGLSKEGEEHIVGVINEEFAIEMYHEGVARQDHDYREGGKQTDSFRIGEKDIEGATRGEVVAESPGQDLDSGYREEREPQPEEPGPTPVEFEETEVEPAGFPLSLWVAVIGLLLGIIALVLYRRRT